eukprot:CAMPEP_0198149154 /NCGR_PEP_ID=MMETSP1443-20131203/45157_1 /TAXON_ID=186043 /ORGANISM="Entomoneis sp., Strain CCMP2396" /LENGTH=490 /DNA_ID=CAMNT_0043814083 /DNA_START=95 /DNA_END=1567 /DNA_ORIENTATION=+
MRFSKGRTLLLLLVIVATLLSSSRVSALPRPSLTPRQKTIEIGDISRRRRVEIRRGGGSSSKSDSPTGAQEGTSSLSQSTFNLVNNVAGAGILALSAGQAAGTGWVPSMIISIILGIISARTFVMVGEACEMLQEEDFKGLWAKTFSEKTTFIVDAMIALLCLCMDVIYSGILGDVSTFLLGQTGIPAHLNNRATNIIITTVGLLLPMSLIKDLSVLSFTSILGFAAVMYTVLLIAYRALDGSYALGSGKFLADGLITAMPSFTKQSLWNVDFTSLILISTLSLAYVSHYNAPIFYRQLENTSSRRFGKLTYSSFILVTLLYMVTMGAGYSTFGEACLGNILLNYHPNDMLATFGRVATWFSILFGFPLVTTGARESLIGAASSFGYPQVGYDKNNFVLVISILTLATVVSCTVKDVSFVVNLTGALFGTFIVYLCPTMIYVRAVELAKGKGSKEYKLARWNNVLLPFGVFIAALGVFITIREQINKVAA